jgi:hypothetical protein
MQDLFYKLKGKFVCKRKRRLKISMYVVLLREFKFIYFLVLKILYVSYTYLKKSHEI